MKGTDHFKKTILMYLEQRAEEDQLFAKSFSNPAKNIDDCVTYILNYVKNSGCNGFTDGEIFGQAIHYYEENEIEVGTPTFAPYPRHRLIGHTAIVLNISATAPRKGTSPVPTAVTSGTATADYATALMVAPAPNAVPNSKCGTPESALTRKRSISA